jgi:hypothetical protein
MNYNIKISYNFTLKKDINNLIKYLNESGFYKSIKKNKCRLDDIGYTEIGNTGIILKTIPYRDSLNKKQKNKLEKVVSKNCALCDAIQNFDRDEPLNLARSILWKGYIIRPNDFPYLNNHLLIMSSDHNHGMDGDRGSQNELHLKKEILFDMVEFFNIMNKEGTMFFNGLAGNTQLHFHFHYVSDKLPIEDFIFNSPNSNANEFNAKNNSKIFIFDSLDAKYCFRGILLIGDDKKVAYNIFQILKKIKSLNYEYNVLFLSKRRNSNDLISIIFIRDNNVVQKKDPPLGASIIAGLYTRPDITCKEARLKKIHKKLSKYCSKIVVTPTKSMIKDLIK